MAESEDEDDLDLKPADAGALFRAEMWATNAILGYWPYLLGTLVVLLLGFLFWGQYSSYVTSSQRQGSAKVAEATYDLDAPVYALGIQKAIGRLDTEDEALTEAAAALVAAAGETSGPAKAEGMLKAAEIYRVVGRDEDRRSALEAASEAAPSGSILWFAAEGALASLDLEQDQGDAAVSRLRSAMESSDGFLGQQAALDLGLALEQLGRSEEALNVYEQFQRKWPDSPRLDEVQERRDRVSG